MGRAAFGMTALAGAYSVALLAYVVAVPADGETLLESSGPTVLALGAQPLLAPLLIGGLLHERCSTGGRVVTVLGRVAIGFLLAYSVLGALSIAAGVFPAAVLLAIAAALTP